VAIALAEALHVSDPEILSPPVSPANAMNGQANLGSTEPTVLPDLESSTVLSSPHIATDAQSSPPSATSMSNGQDIPATPPDASDEEGRRSESAASAFTTVATNPSLSSVQASADTTSPAPASAPSTPTPEPSQASADTTSPPSASAPPEPASASSQTSAGTTSPASSSPSPRIPVVVSPPEPAKPERRQGHFKRNLTIVLLIILILLLVASTVVAIFVFPRKQANPAPAATTLPVVGHVYFLSSGKLY